MQAVHEANQSATNAIQSTLRKLENAWNSADVVALAGLLVEDAWIIDARGSNHRYKTDEMLLVAQLVGCADVGCYCVLIVEHLLFLTDDIGYTVVKMSIRDGDADTPIEWRCLMILRPAPNDIGWLIHLLHIGVCLRNVQPGETFKTK